MRKHLYNQPIPVRQTIPDHPGALRLDLPEPPNGDSSDQAFLYRIEGKVVGFFNRCGHVRLPMDLDDGKFFDLEGMIICRVHGARFDETEGHCIMGPSPVGLYRLLLKRAENSGSVTGPAGPVEGDRDPHSGKPPDDEKRDQASSGAEATLAGIFEEGSNVSTEGSILILGWEGPVAPEQH